MNGLRLSQLFRIMKTSTFPMDMKVTSVVVGRLKKVLNQTGYLDILDIQPERHTNYQFTRYSIAGKLEIGNWYTIKIFKL